MGAIFILLAVRAMIGTWNMAGTIPRSSPTAWHCCARPSSSQPSLSSAPSSASSQEAPGPTAGTLGVAFVGMAPVLKMSEAIAAAAVISGGYMGDKMSPLSETTVLVPQLVGGVTTNQPIRGMLTTVVP